MPLEYVSPIRGSSALSWMYPLESKSLRAFALPPFARSRVFISIFAADAISAPISHFPRLRTLASRKEDVFKVEQANKDRKPSPIRPAFKGSMIFPLQGLCLPRGGRGWHALNTNFGAVRLRNRIVISKQRRARILYQTQKRSS